MCHMAWVRRHGQRCRWANRTEVFLLPAAIFHFTPVSLSRQSWGAGGMGRCRGDGPTVEFYLPTWQNSECHTCCFCPPVQFLHTGVCETVRRIVDKEKLTSWLQESVWGIAVSLSLIGKMTNTYKWASYGTTHTLNFISIHDVHFLLSTTDSC